MPFWLSILINLALKLGLPWLEKKVSPELLILIEQILAQLKTVPSEIQKEVVGQMQDHFDGFKVKGLELTDPVKS